MKHQIDRLSALEGPRLAVNHELVARRFRRFLNALEGSLQEVQKEHGQS